MSGRVEVSSYLAMQAKAATLYERASKLASLWDTGENRPLLLT